MKRLLGKALEVSKLQKRGPVGEELVYAPNEEKPYTGWVKKMYSNGQAAEVVSYKDGKRHGRSASWFADGQKKEDRVYKHGEPDGLTTAWYENGEVETREHYKDGVLIKKED